MGPRIEVIVVGHAGERVIASLSETEYVDLGPPDLRRHALEQQQIRVQAA